MSITEPSPDCPETPDTTTDGLTTRYVYDAEGNLIKTVYPHQYYAENDSLDIVNNINTYNDDTVGERATYDENGNVLTYIDSFGKETVNTYDNRNHLVKSVTDGETTRYVYDGDDLIEVIYPEQYILADDGWQGEAPENTYANPNVGDRYEYDENGNVTKYTDRFGNTTENFYDENGNLTSIKKDGVSTFDFDDESRATKETYSNGFIRDFTYTSNQTVITGSNGITVTYNLNSFGEVAEYKIKNGENNKDYSYTYDSDGNITTISLNGSLQQTFTYNSSNEIVRVDDAVANKTVTYDYDYVGNITAVNTYSYTTGELGIPESTESYNYNEKNQIKDLSYDANGNITSLNGFDFTWDGRRLTFATSTDNSISYTYNHSGIRTSKTINGITTYYEVDENNNVVKQYELENDVETNVIEFIYDSNNTPIYFTYNNAIYYYEKNLQGDIVAILDSNGNSVVEYTYNIWGELASITGTLADTLGVVNPLRYRGYYYDTETGLYYLQSRYYSPDLMRFISQDEPHYSNEQGQPLGSNLYVYCLNNPVVYIDCKGTDAIILQSKESVFNFGHTGLLIQYGGNWYYWYWGMDFNKTLIKNSILAINNKSASIFTRLALLAMGLSKTIVNTLCGYISAISKLTRVCSNSKITYYSSLYTIHKLLINAKVGYQNEFEKGLYLKGDFSKSYTYLKNMKNTGRYSLLFNNCMQTSLSALQKGKFNHNNLKNQLRIAIAKSFVIPNLAYNYLKSFFTSLVWRRS